MNEFSPNQVSVIYLSDLPLLNLSTSGQTATGSCWPKLQDIFGFATPGTDSITCRHMTWWALTPPSHPYPNLGRGGYFLLRYHTLTDISLPIAIGIRSRMPFVARTFLPDPVPIAIGAGSGRQNDLLWGQKY
jgi:hypothetical protein